MTRTVLLPGMNNDSQMWRPMIAALPKDFDAIAVDIPAEPQFNRLVDRVAEEHVPQRSLIVGHSLGGLVAMGLAERHPDSVAGLVLTGASNWADGPEQISDRLAKAARGRDGAFEEMAMDNLSRLFHGDRADDPAVRAERLRGVRAYGVERYYAHSLAIVERPDRTGFLQTLDIPILMVIPSNDVTIPTEMQRNWAIASGVDYVEIADTGHMLPAEEPAALAHVIVDWWARVDRN